MFKDIKNDMDKFESTEAKSMRAHLADLREELQKKSFELHALDKIYQESLKNYQIYVGLREPDKESKDGSTVQ